MYAKLISAFIISFIALFSTCIYWYYDCERLSKNVKILMNDTYLSSIGL